jgi:hypothetical protein
MVYIINHLKIFSIQPLLLRLLGIWPGPDSTFRRKQICVALINITCIIFILYCECRSTINSSDIQSLIANTFTFVIRSLATVKVLIMIWKREDLQRLIRNLIDMIESDTDLTSKDINRQMSNLEFRCMVGILSAYEITLLIVLIAPILKWLISGQNVWELPILVQ